MKNQGHNPKRTGQESCALESSSKQSLFSFLRNARDMQMTTRVTEGARRKETLFFLLRLPPLFPASLARVHFPHYI